MQQLFCYNSNCYETTKIVTEMPSLRTALWVYFDVMLSFIALCNRQLEASSTRFIQNWSFGREIYLGSCKQLKLKYSSQCHLVFILPLLPINSLPIHGGTTVRGLLLYFVLLLIVKPTRNSSQTLYCLDEFNPSF